MGANVELFLVHASLDKQRGTDLIVPIQGRVDGSLNGREIAAAVLGNSQIKDLGLRGPGR